MLDFNQSNVGYRTFFVPGLLGYGNDSLMGRLFPYFAGISNIETVSVGPVNTTATRARNLFTYIRHVYPEWSATNPINLVGHSMGCNTILAMVELDGVDPTSINGIVQISPCNLGVSSTFRFGRHTHLNYKCRIIVGILQIYEWIVPVWIRRTLLIDTMLSSELRMFDDRAALFILGDVGERHCRASTERVKRYLARHKIPLRTIVTCSSLQSVQGSFYISLVYGSQILLRLGRLFFGAGGKTDGEMGHSLMHENVLDHTLREGTHDGILLVTSQLGDCPFMPEVQMINAPHLHLSTAGLTWYFDLGTRASTHRTMQSVIEALNQVECDERD